MPIIKIQYSKSIRNQNNKPYYNRGRFEITEVIYCFNCIFFSHKKAVKYYS